jgi:hypothetical protein
MKLGGERFHQSCAVHIWNILVFGCSQCISEGKACQANIVLSQDDYPSPTVCRLINLLYSSKFI